MAACAFVKSSVNEREPLISEEQRQETREDVEVIDSSLRFVNDLLRNMLGTSEHAAYTCSSDLTYVGSILKDMHRSQAQFNLKYEITDVLHDILEPVGGMVIDRLSGRVGLAGWPVLGQTELSWPTLIQLFAAVHHRHYVRFGPFRRNLKVELLVVVHETKNQIRQS